MQMMPLQYAQAPDYSKALAALTSAAGPLAKAVNPPAGAAPPTALPPGSPVPGAAGPTSVGSPTAGPMPMQQQPPTLLDALKNMSPSQIMASLQRASTPPAPGLAVPPQGAPQAPDPNAQPGSALFQQAGMGPG